MSERQIVRPGTVSCDSLGSPTIIVASMEVSMEARGIAGFVAARVVFCPHAIKQVGGNVCGGFVILCEYVLDA